MEEFSIVASTYKLNYAWSGKYKYQRGSKIKITNLWNSSLISLIAHASKYKDLR